MAIMCGPDCGASGNPAICMKCGYDGNNPGAALTITESLEMLLDRLEREDRPLYDGEICREAIWEIKRLQEVERRHYELCDL